MTVSFRGEPITKQLVPVYPGASTVTGFIGTTDVGKLCMASSNHGVLAVGTTADFAQAAGILGVIASVPEATTPASTVPFYVRPITPFDEVEISFSTVASTVLPNSTDRGKYVGFSNTTTVAGAVISMGTLGNARGTTSGCFLKISGYDTDRRTVWGHVNSSHIVY